MGTNYYLVDRTDECKCCGHGVAKHHIGKSSGGWCFSMHVGYRVIHPLTRIETEIKDFESLKPFLSLLEIRDEYGEVISEKEILSIIQDRWTDKSPPRHSICEGAEVTSDNLLRMKIDGRYCVGHGEGTWTYHAGEFS